MVEAASDELIGHLKAGLNACPEWGTNSGHGHVWRRPDGKRMRCGGPALCVECSKDLARSRTADFNRDTVAALIARIEADKKGA